MGVTAGSAATSKVLLVAPVPTHPSTTGASTRVRQMAESLRCMGHEVHFLYLQQPLWESDAAMREHWGSRYHVFRGLSPSSCVARARRKLRRIWSKTFHTNVPVDSYFDPECGRDGRARVAPLGFDTVIVSYVFYSKILDAFPPTTLKIIDTHDVFSDRYRLYEQHGQRAEFFSTSPAEESRGLERADVVLAIQGSDAMHFRGLTGKPVGVVGHLAAPTRLPASSRPPVEGSMLFVGGPMSINAHGVGRARVRQAFSTQQLAAEVEQVYDGLRSGGEALPVQPVAGVGAR